MKYIYLLTTLILLAFHSSAQSSSTKIIPAAERTTVYFPMLQGKKVGVVANHTSMVGNQHLVDALLQNGIQVTKIFGPEHGFRGTAGAGEKVSSGKDENTGLTVVSLYGNKRKPSPADMKGLDIIVFDIQDVGVRFYTYISTLQYIMEACFENNIPLLVLDRPNPHGHYIDGPVLKKGFNSFVGMQPVPLVYGMTIGEYALMIAGEGWLTPTANAAYAVENKKKINGLMTIITCENYDHTKEYELPIAPSPNLPTQANIRMYPTTGLIEGTVLSEGRGTPQPFLYIGHPTLPKKLFSFTPKPTAAAPKSKCYNQTCYGWDLTTLAQQKPNRIYIEILLNAYQQFPGKDTFFLKDFFQKLSGGKELMNQIISGDNEMTIRADWQADIDEFKAIRKKYLLYQDFE